VQLAKAWGSDEISVRTRRKELGIRAVFSRVDTCAAEFESFTPTSIPTTKPRAKPTPARARKS